MFQLSLNTSPWSKREVFDTVVVVAVLTDWNQAAINTGIPSVGGNIRQVGVGLWVGDSHRFEAAVHHIADGQQKFSEDKRNVDEQLFFDCLLYTSPSPRDGLLSRMPSSA